MEEKEIKIKYNNWNNLKQNINISKIPEFYVKEKQIWYIHNWLNIWFESNWKWDDFKRPVLVLKKVGALFFVATMTTKWKNNKFYYSLDKSYFNKESSVSLSQVKIIDKKRFFEQIWKISWEDFKQIKKELQDMLF